MLGGDPEYCWYPQTKKELKELGFEVMVPAMPDTENPDMKTWVPKLREVIGELSEDVYLVGHSIGCATIMRYLESLGESEKVDGVVFVAGFIDDLGMEEIHNFFTTPIDLGKIKTKANHFVAIHSDNDPFVPLKHGDIFKEKLGAELIVKHKKSNAVCTFLTTVVHDPQGYGRVIRDANGMAVAIREDKDATGFERNIAEINTGVYCCQGKELFLALKEINMNKKKREFYFLTRVSKPRGE